MSCWFKIVMSVLVEIGAFKQQANVGEDLLFGWNTDNVNKWHFIGKTKYI